jgi:beta-N-acetylhexosaminidase
VVKDDGVRPRILVAFTTTLLATAACSSGGGPDLRPQSPSTSSSPSASSTPSTPSSLPGSSSTDPSSSASPRGSSTPPPRDPVERVFAAMSEAERVGQLLMVDCPSTGVSAATVQAIRADHVGSIILDGTTTAGQQAVAQVSRQAEDDNPSAAKLFIATDQEGGLVQRLQGAGFSRIPSGVEQGSIPPATLQADARDWGGQLRGAGVTVDLAPVLDTVPVGQGPNPPIGDLERQYGSTPAAVTAHGVAVARGLAQAGVVATVKHFPGLGRVSGNTDETGGVTDTVTTRRDPYLAPFRAAIRARVPFVMVSTAIYSRIDPGTPAAFSKTIITGMLRHDLGFTGVVITDDVGHAAQVAGVPVADRAVRFVRAGGDIVLTVDASQAGTMAQALLVEAGRDASFKQLVDAAVLRVLRAKQAAGLLG